MGDRSRLLNFTEHYTYDDRANLIKLQHQREGNNYTREMRIAVDSNRGLPWKTSDPEPDFANRFDANGNLQSLQAGQPLEWNTRNQLQRVTLLERTEQEADTETYLYDGNGQRVRKRQTKKAHTITQCCDVIYLPGLELRVSERENLEVISVQAGNCNIRCLHWSLGKPSAITNDALRYSFDDHLGSNSMELDAEGNLISEEGYYPFGGTAWRAARNAQEANYRTIRYSGKERDASGLYYYGQRYYASWLQRWISPDPAGLLDGLNLYRFAGNNPITHKDYLGLMKYEIEPYSSSPKSAAPLSTRTAVAHNALPRGTFIDATEANHYALAYDVIWSTRSLLYLGAGNQIGDISNSHQLSSTHTSLLRTNIGTTPTLQATAEHAVAASSGYCDEFAAVSARLAASSARGFGTPVNHAQVPGHTFTLLGDPQGDPLVVDPWVIYPVPHKLSESLYAHSPLTSTNLTPRMPQDPRYEVSVNAVNTLAGGYGNVLPPQPAALHTQIVNEYLGPNGQSSWIWDQLSSQQHSSDVEGYLNNSLVNFAEVPQPHVSRLDNATLHAAIYAARFPTNPFRRF